MTVTRIDNDQPTVNAAVKLKRGSHISDWPCFFCNVATGAPVVASFRLGFVEHIVCGDCLDDGPGGAAEMLLARAQGYEEHARVLRQKAFWTWEFPTHDEWTAAQENPEAYSEGWE